MAEGAHEDAIDTASNAKGSVPKSSGAGDEVMVITLTDGLVMAIGGDPDTFLEPNSANFEYATRISVEGVYSMTLTCTGIGCGHALGEDNEYDDDLTGSTYADLSPLFACCRVKVAEFRCAG